jgi:hypothetical protein
LTIVLNSGNYEPVREKPKEASEGMSDALLVGLAELVVGRGIIEFPPPIKKTNLMQRDLMHNIGN